MKPEDSTEPMSIPPITVIMPVYNAAKFLDEAIQSILNQSFTNFEFIIIDDFSADDSPSIIKKYADLDKRIVYIQNDRNIGNIATRNKAIDRARGIYIAELDGDDVAFPRRLEIQYHYLLEHPEITLIGGGAQIINDRGSVIGNKRPSGNFNLLKYKMLFQNPFVHSTIFYKKDPIKKVGGYNPEYNHAEDYSLYYTLLQNGYRLGSVPDIIIRYLRHQQSITALPESRRIQLASTYRISHHHLNKYLPVSYQKTEMLVDAVNCHGVNLLSVLSTIIFCRKLTDRFIKKEGLNDIESQKIWKAYVSDKKWHLLKNYLKINLPGLAKIIKKAD